MPPSRYANCFRGNSDFNVHAEEFLLTDKAFHSLIDELKEEYVEAHAEGQQVGAVKLLLYMTYQPCHHSGGRVPRGTRQLLRVRTT